MVTFEKLNFAPESLDIQTGVLPDVMPRAVYVILAKAIGKVISVVDCSYIPALLPPWTSYFDAEIQYTKYWLDQDEEACTVNCDLVSGLSRLRLRGTFGVMITGGVSETEYEIGNVLVWSTCVCANLPPWLKVARGELSKDMLSPAAVAQQQAVYRGQFPGLTQTP